MRVYMTSDTYLPDIGGAEVHVFELQKRLRQAGVDLTLFVTNPSTATEDAAYPVLRDAWSGFQIPRLFLRLWRTSRGVDVYHSHYSYKLASLLGIIARLRCKPFIITQHGLGLLDQAGGRWPYRQIHACYRWLSMKLATFVISTSEDLATFCEPYISRQRLEVIPNGLDTKVFSQNQVKALHDPRWDAAEPMLLTVRRLVPKCGIHYLISALPFIRERYPHVKLVMIGDGRMRSFIEARAERLKVADACVFLGARPNHEVAAIAVGADAVVFPSTAESTSIACAEMMSLEKRIVASRVGGLIELLGAEQSRGWLVKLVPWEACDYAAPDELPEDRYRALATTVISALEDPQANQRTQAAREYALNHLDWSVVVARTQAVYQRLMGKTLDN